MSRSVSRAARLRHIENLLFRSSKGLRVVEIADACQVNRRTIYRDLDLLDQTGVPIWQDGNRFGIIRDQYLATIRLRFNEAAALYIAARLLARHADEHNPHIVSALHKIATAFPDPLAEQVNITASSIQDQPVNPQFVSVLETITKCWADNRKVTLWYKSPRSGNVRQRVIAPYTIEPSAAGGLYVIGFDDTTQSIRTFKLERLERAQELYEEYDIPDEFDPRVHFANAWGIMVGEATTEIVLKFSATVATFIRERIWHPSQSIEAEADGSITLRVHIAEPVEMHPWIRSWGAEVEVVQPDTLRDTLAQEAQRLLELYTHTGNR